MSIVKYKSGDAWVSVATSGAIATRTTYGYVKLASSEDISQENYTSAITGGVLYDYTNKFRTNCLLEIPQDIKVELNNGNLTIKAGSKVYVPNGFEQDGTTKKFDVVVIENDFTPNTYNNKQDMHFWNCTQQYTGRTPANSCVSSDTEPTSPTNYMFWYNTSTNVIRRYVDGAWTNDVYSLPIFIATEGESSYISIDQVFNGFGYIGSTVFALPGVKGLIPYGRNADGTMNNKTLTLSSVLTNSSPGTSNRYLLLNMANNLILGRLPDEVFISNTKPIITNSALQQYWFNPDENIMYRTMDNGTTWNQSDTLVVGAYKLGTTFEYFTTKPTFNAVDYYDAAIQNRDNNFSGVNSFTQDVVSKASNSSMLDATRSSSEYNRIIWKDKNNYTTSVIQTGYTTDGKRKIQLAARNNTNTDWEIPLSIETPAYSSTPAASTITANNTWTFTQTIQGTAYRAYWGDLAEYYLTDNEYPKGTLIQFGGEKEITIAKNKVNAVITSDPGFILNSEQKDSQAIALIGRVPVRVIGKVNKFDKIALSYIDGVGCVNNDSENPIGIALESKDDSDEGLIICSVKINL